ncbi:MAG: AEC family transporter [Maritimibacter sp.]|nr:AEC family transporter [Maritimibacter sp.]
MLVTTIWPLFALIVLGFALARIDFPDPGFWPAAERLNYHVLFPALLVTSLVRAPLTDPALVKLGGAAAVTILIAAAALLGLRLLRPIPPARFGPVLQGTVRFNTYLGLAVVTTLAGADGQSRAAVYLAVAVPLVNVLSIVALTEGNVWRRPGLLLRSMGTNPLIHACLLGIALALTGIGLPFGTGALLDFLARASLPLGLLCVGAALRPAALRSDLPTILGVAALRLLAMPALAAAVALGFGLSAPEALVLVVFSAIPTATAAFVLTRQMGGDGELMAGILTAQTLAAVVTIPLVLALFTT